MSGWADKLKQAREKAIGEADRQTQIELDLVLREAAELDGIMDDLKLNDQATYDKLMTVVQEATDQNLEIAAVVDRFKALGRAGGKFASVIGNLSGAGALKTVLKALKDG